MRFNVRLLGIFSLFIVGVAVGCGTSAAHGGDHVSPSDGTEPVVGDGGALLDGANLPSGTTIEHVLSTGQSNAVGFNARPPLSMEQPYGNLMFDPGVMTSADCDPDGCKRYEKPRAFAGLVEGDTYFADKVETMSSGMANEIAKLSGASSRRLLVSNHGRSGNTYECLRKLGCSFLDGKGYVKPFEEALMQVADAKALAAAAGAKYTVRAVTAIHGESDHYAAIYPLESTGGTAGAIANYGDALVEWQRDYDAAVRAITGQSEPVPLLISQMANWNDTPHSEIPGFQLGAHVRTKGSIVVVGPTYQLPYTDDCIHFTSEGERQLGEYFAKAYHRIVDEKGTWEPLRPAQATAAGNVVTVKLIVPKPPLVLDTALVSDPGSAGFEVVDAAGAPIAIESVALSGPDTIAITVAAGAALTGAHVRYAFTAQPETCPGPTSGPRGNLRDSDDTASNYGYPLFNWAVSFDVGIE